MTTPDWLALAVTAIPLFGIAGSSIAYVFKQYQEASEHRRTRFFELLQFIDGTGPIAAKLGAVYALRNFKEHDEFLERFFQTQRTQISGSNAQSLVDEFDATLAVIANRK